MIAEWTHDMRIGRMQNFITCARIKPAVNRPAVKPAQPESVLPRQCQSCPVKVRKISTTFNATINAVTAMLITCLAVPSTYSPISSRSCV